MIHVKGGIGEIKNQIHKDDIAKNTIPLVTATRARVALLT
jgi:hypothetical protein